MTVKTKLLVFCVFLAALFSCIIIAKILINSELDEQLKHVTKLSDEGREKSKNAMSNIRGSQQSITETSASAQTLASDLQAANQQVKILSRKIKEVSGQMAEFVVSAEELQSALPPGDARYVAEDLAYELEDIQERLDKEALINLSKMEDDVDNFTAVLSANAASLSDVSDGFSSVLNELNIVEKDIVGITDSLATINQSQTANGNTMMVSLAISTLIVILVTLAIIRTITKPLMHVQNTLGNLSDGDFTNQIEIKRQDEFGDLATSINVLSGKLRGAITEISNEAQNLNEISNRINMTSKKSQDVTEQQRQKGNDVSSVMEDMAKSVNEVTQSIASTANSSRQADEQVTEGIGYIHENIQSMESLKEDIEKANYSVKELEDSSKQIDTVIEVIRSIAEQTNLLALNAAIEAARAGEHGRGFAVVAEQVRSLANKTHESTGEITSIITHLNKTSGSVVTTIRAIREQATTASDKAQEVNEKFTIIDRQVSEVNKMNSAIASSAENQSKMSVLVESNLDESKLLMSETVDANQDVVVASKEVQKSSASLVDLLKQFKVA